MLRKILNNYIKTKNKHFKSYFFLKKMIDIYIYIYIYIYNLSYLIIILFTLIKNINFISVHLLLSYIIYHFTIIL